MPDLSYDPPLPQRPNDEPLIQRIDLREKDELIATLRWHSPAGPDGVVQLLDLTVTPAHRRAGHASTVLAAAIKQIVAHGKARKVPVRRIWVNVEQKSQVNARAFLTRHSFHHVGTVRELLKNQDALVYMRSLD